MVIYPSHFNSEKYPAPFFVLFSLFYHFHSEHGSLDVSIFLIVSPLFALVTSTKVFVVMLNNFQSKIPQYSNIYIFTKLLS